MTYIIATVFLLLTSPPFSFLNAFIPAIGYVLSMQSIPLIKKLWIKKKKAQ